MYQNIIFSLLLVAIMASLVSADTEKVKQIEVAETNCKDVCATSPDDSMADLQCASCLLAESGSPYLADFLTAVASVRFEQGCDQDLPEEHPNLDKEQIERSAKRRSRRSRGRSRSESPTESSESESESESSSSSSSSSQCESESSSSSSSSSQCESESSSSSSSSSQCESESEESTQATKPKSTRHSHSRSTKGKGKKTPTKSKSSSESSSASTVSATERQNESETGTGSRSKRSARSRTSRRSEYKSSSESSSASEGNEAASKSKTSTRGKGGGHYRGRRRRASELLSMTAPKVNSNQFETDLFDLFTTLLGDCNRKCSTLSSCDKDWTKCVQCILKKTQPGMLTVIKLKQ